MIKVLILLIMISVNAFAKCNQSEIKEFCSSKHYESEELTEEAYFNYIECNEHLTGGELITVRDANAYCKGIE